MKTVTSEVPSSIELLALIRLKPADRQRAEGALRQGEALDNLLLGAAQIVKGWVAHHQQHAIDPRHLKSAN